MATPRPAATLVSSRNWMREGGGHMVLRKNKLKSEIPDYLSSSLIMRGSFLEKLRRVCFLPDRHTAGYLFDDFVPDGLAQTQMVLVATGSTMPEPLYVLWGDDTTSCTPKRSFAISRWETSESANRVLSGTGGDLGGGDAPIPEKQLKKRRIRPWNCPRC